MQQGHNRDLFPLAIVLVLALGLAGCSSNQMTSWSALVEGVEGNMQERQGGPGPQPSIPESQGDTSVLFVGSETYLDTTGPSTTGSFIQCPSCLGRLKPSEEPKAQDKVRCAACGAVFTLTPGAAEAANSDKDESHPEP